MAEAGLRHTATEQSDATRSSKRQSDHFSPPAFPDPGSSPGNWARMGDNCYFEFWNTKESTRFVPTSFSTPSSLNACHVHPATE
ncbi:hypothetical protein [Lampropedia cohaerens]|uniref:hypothetical protein n=1 Tax=Lampropedia cohaerens TaxID=1610491 RepID=UPI0012E35F8D|nr:hypothetical protein [Lampropedia cohaerens]